MDFAINDREPTVTLLRSKLVELQNKITAYKTAVSEHYSIEYQRRAIAENTTDIKRVKGNNGTVSCNKYCHGNGGTSWNRELPSNWKGAQCLSAGAQGQFRCQDANKYDINPTGYTPPPIRPTSFADFLKLGTVVDVDTGLRTTANSGSTPPVVAPGAAYVASATAAAVAGTGNAGSAAGAVAAATSGMGAAATGTGGAAAAAPAGAMGGTPLTAVTNINITSAGPGAPLAPGIQLAGQLDCVCKRNDSFPFSESNTGDDGIPNDPLYTFSEGIVPQSSCGLQDLGSKRITKQCLQDLWLRSNCSIPLTIPTSGPYSLPGSSLVFDVSGEMIDMTTANKNYAYLTTFLLPQSIRSTPSACGIPPTLAAMNDEIHAGFDEITKLINTVMPNMTDNVTYKTNNSQKLLDHYIKLKSTFDELQTELEEPIRLDGNYEMTSIRVSSNFSNFILILLFTLFMIGSLIFIFKNPDVGNLDMFILALAVIIFVYYLYEYIQKRRKQ